MLTVQSSAVHFVQKMKELGKVAVHLKGSAVLEIKSLFMQNEINHKKA
jgi:hypothetical protein